MTMRFKLLGRSGLRVSELGLGTLTFGPETGWGQGKEESLRIFRTYVEAGGNFLDTANTYNKGISEEWTGEFIRHERDRYVVATKFSLNMRPGDPNAGGNHRKNIVQSLEASLRRLKTDYVDLYWLHQWDGTTPVDEVVQALDDLVRAGKVLYLGISNTPAWIVSQANTLAELRGWTRFVGLQIEYSLIERTPERELLPMARALGLAVTPWGAVGGGVLTGKYHSAPDPAAAPDSHRAALYANTARTSARSLAIAAETQAIAQETGRSAAQVALSWVRRQGRQIVPLVGARTEAQLRDNLACLDLILGPEQLARLEQASAIELGYPHDFNALPRIVEQRHGGTQHLQDWDRDW